MSAFRPSSRQRKVSQSRLSKQKSKPGELHDYELQDLFVDADISDYT
jgi:hypothetical protein